MDKNLGLGGGNTKPSAPPPTAPPSYEEAVAIASTAAPHHINPLPYPVGPPSMPFPTTYNPPPNQKTVPLPPNYSRVNEPMLQTQIQRTTNPEFVQPQEIRIIHQRITYVSNKLKSLSANPVRMTCPSCQANIKTITISDHQPSAHVCCIVLCLIGCFICSCLPYCMSAFKSVHHFCPNCKNHIGTVKGRV